MLSFQASVSSQGPLDESVAQQKVEATAENNACSSHSSGYNACVQRNRECIEKGSDAQVICIILMEFLLATVTNITYHEIFVGYLFLWKC